MNKYNPFQFHIIIKNCRVITGIVLCILLFNSCKDCGCNDPAAINYNITADKNDGSCEYCDTTWKQFATRTITLKDFNTASVHYNQVVAMYILRQHSVTYNELVCGKNSCMIFLNLESVVNQEMEFTYSISSGNPLFISSTRHVIIPANATYVADTVQIYGNNPCGNLNGAFVSVSVINGYIVYH